MTTNININEMPKEELYWEKEKVCDMAFQIEEKYRKAKTEKLRNKLWLIFLDLLDVQRKYDRMLREEFGD